jgi:hypothetical protein
MKNIVRIKNFHHPIPTQHLNYHFQAPTFLALQGASSGRVSFAYTRAFVN